MQKEAMVVVVESVRGPIEAEDFVLASEAQCGRPGIPRQTSRVLQGFGEYVHTIPDNFYQAALAMAVSRRKRR